MAGTVMDIQEHGSCVDKKKTRVKCNYCGKEMSGWSRLKCHLGGVGPCDQVTFKVIETFRNMAMKEKSGLTAAKRGGEVRMGNPRKRGRSEVSSSKSVSPENGNTCAEDNKQDLLLNEAQMSIGRFFYEWRIDFSAVDSSRFKEMLRATAVCGGQMRLKIPDLNGWIHQEALKEVQDHVKKIKDSWEITGCSLLLDAWVDQKGCDLVSFVADCPAGPVYLKSLDVSDIKGNSNALIPLVDELVEEIGVHNVIQIIACSTSGWVGELGESFADNNNKVFWSVSISHCFELMLAKIGEMDSFGDILDKVNNISKFINNNPLVLKLFEDHSHGIDMKVSSSEFEFEFVTPYLTVDSIFKAKNKLTAMFALSDGNEEGITISKLVKDSSFWESVERVLKSTRPLIHGLLLFSIANNQHVGYIYDTMDGIKESIAREFNHKELCYKPLWDVIDDVWYKHLNSPLHLTGFITCAGRMTEESRVVTIIGRQLEMYRVGKDCFNEASQADEISGIAPAEWWAQKASQCPELQSFAIKILSQTCEGASRYKLKRRCCSLKE